MVASSSKLAAGSQESCSLEWLWLVNRWSARDGDSGWWCRMMSARWSSGGAVRVGSVSVSVAVFVVAVTVAVLQTVAWGCTGALAGLYVAAALWLAAALSLALPPAGALAGL